MSIKPKNESKDESQESPDLPRRDFLRLGVALTAGATIAHAGLAAPAGAIASGSTPVTAPVIGDPIKGTASAGAKVALGYWPRGATLISGVAPSTLPAGDPAFEQSGAHVIIQGTRSGIVGERQALLLDFFPDTSNGAALHVLAWAAGEVSMGAGDAVPNQPGGTIMQVPVQTVRGSLGLIADFSGTLSPIVLSTGAARGAAKLQSGTYVVAAPVPGSSLLPDLTQWAWKPGDKAASQGTLAPVAPHVTPLPLSAKSVASSVPNFPYIVIEVSYGTLG